MLSVLSSASGVTSENAKNAATETSPGKMTSQRTSNSERRGHMKAVKIFLGLLLMYIVSFVPLWLITTNESFDRLWVYLYYLNHACNILVYYVVDPEFRHELKKLVIKQWINYESITVRLRCYTPGFEVSEKVFHFCLCISYMYFYSVVWWLWTL